MASNKKRPTTTPAPWVRDSIARQHELERKAFAARSDAAYEHWIEQAEKEVQRRDSEKEYLKDSIRLVRQFVHGFDARDGFSLKDVVRLRGPKLSRLRKYAAIIRQEQAQPHVTKVVRPGAQRRAIQSHTGQRDIPERFKYIVYTEKPAVTKVRIVTPRKRKGKPKKVVRPKPRRVDTGEELEIPEEEREYTGPALRKPRVEVALELPGGTSREEFFYVENYNNEEPPETFKDIKRALKKMLPDMPKGYYVLVTSNHGNIGVPANRSNLLRMIDSDYMAYDRVPVGAGSKDNRGLAGVVVGFKLVSFTKEGADREYKERLTRRAMLEQERQGQRRRSRESRRARLTGRR